MPDRDHTHWTEGEVKQLLGRLKASFVEELEEIGHEAGARCLRLFDVWRQVSLRRIVDLAEGAEAFFVEGRLVPGCTLARSVVETVALKYTVWKKLDALVSAADSQGVHRLLMSAVFGRRDKGDDWPNKSLNVPTTIDHLDKQFPSFRSECNRLSEYAHPGLAGGYGAYVRTEGERLRSYFGQNPCRLDEGPWGRTELELALRVAVTFNDFLEEARPRLGSLLKHEQ